jgi:hypothetical protein
MNPQAETEQARPPRVLEPADESDVMLDQLECLIGHVAERGICGCSECRRYLRARDLLLEIFNEPNRQPVRELAKAA